MGAAGCLTRSVKDRGLTPSYQKEFVGIADDSGCSRPRARVVDRRRSIPVAATMLGRCSEAVGVVNDGGRNCRHEHRSPPLPRALVRPRA